MNANYAIEHFGSGYAIATAKSAAQFNIDYSNTISTHYLMRDNLTHKDADEIYKNPSNLVAIFRIKSLNPSTMQTTIRNQHQRLNCIMDLIILADNRIVTYKKQMAKYDDSFWRNIHIKQINRYRAIRKRLYAYYSEVFTRIAVTVIEFDKVPA